MQRASVARGASSLFAASADALHSALRAYDDRELEATRYFLPR
jgi:hypothetical protein